jgi:DNA-directed RNA polymerase specialized sigma24 family protein
MRMDGSTYRDLRAQARRLTRSASDADDLVQDVLIAALQAGRSEPAWLSGVLQRQAAMTVRSIVRRRRREQRVMQDADPGAACGSLPTPAYDFLARRLPPAARRVALLALHGLDADEIRWILGLTPAAFRQRLTSIRRTLGALPPALRNEALALAYVRDPARTVELQFGLVRRALKAALLGGPGLATHDADGHLLVIRTDAHTSTPRGNEQAGTTEETLPC